MEQETQKEIEGFKRVMDEMLALKTKKAGDYGQSWKTFGLQGLYAQIGRKFARIWLNKDKKPEEINNEMFRDSLIDMAVYCIMSIQLIDSGETEDMIIQTLKGIK